MEEVKSKKCSKCKQVKSVKEFNRDNSSTNTSDYQSYCKSCNTEYYRENKERLNRLRRERRKNSKKVREKEAQARIERDKENPELYLWWNAKRRADKNNLDFTIKPEDISIPVKCPLLEIKLGEVREGRNSNSPSLDRIDSDKGYTPNNIKVISSKANLMKSNATKEELIAFSSNILKYLET